MAIFEWNHSYDVGIEEVDEQHRGLVRMLNELDAAYADGVEGTVIQKLLGGLLEYTHYHFSTEEQLMQAVDCDHDHYAAHKEEHEEFVRTVVKMASGFDGSDTTIVEPLLDYLIKWLALHIMGSDKEMARLIAAKTGASADAAVDDGRELHLRRALDMELAERNVLAALRESESRFRVLADSVPVLIWMTEQDAGRMFFNKTWLDFTGRTLAQERGDGWEASLHPDEREECLELYRKSFAARQRYVAEYRLQRADGKYHWLLETGVPRYESHGGFAGFVGSAVDITERKMAELVLRNARDQLEKRVAERTHQIENLRSQHELLLNSAGIGIYGTDLNLNTTFINPAAAQMVGWQVEDLLGKPVHDLIHHTHADGRHYPAAECPISAAVREGRMSRVENEVFWHKDGTPFEVEYTITPLIENGRPAGAVVMFSDISARKQSERQLQQSHEELKALNGKLADAQGQLLQSEKLASIGQLAAGVAHEINNPIGFVNSNLGTMGNYLESLFKLVESFESVAASAREKGVSTQSVEQVKKAIDYEFLKEDLDSLLKESRDGVQRVRRIVQDLKDFSHVDEAEWQWADINRGIESTLNVAWPEIKYKAEVEKDYGVLPEILCLPQQLNQVFMNILVNAAQAIDGQGKITIRTAAADGGVCTTFSDTGKGMPADVVKRIFDPFFTTKPIGKGTGLGLSLAYGIVQKHKGRIEVDSEPGKGTTFRVW
ncbi:MAG: bacteriohemerythrin, partial [Sulfuricella sp.]|nr:bacteriohemerythrin [Sulfuricella sp.]